MNPFQWFFRAPLMIYLTIGLCFAASSANTHIGAEKTGLANLPHSSTETPVVTIGQAYPEEYQQGEQLFIPIMAEGFTGENTLFAVTLHIQFDQQVLTYDGYTRKHLSGSITHSSNGVFSLAWSSISGEEITSDTLGVIRFVYNDGFTALSFREDCELAGEDDNIVVELIDGEAGYKPPTYNVSLSVNPPEGGTAILSGENPFVEGETVTLTASPATGYSFLYWSETNSNVVVSENPVFQFEILSDRKLTAHFLIQTFQLSASVTPEGSGEVEGTGMYEYGTEAGLFALAREGYVFLEWREDGEWVGEEEHLDIRIESDRHLQAFFEKKTYTLLYEAEPGGYLSGEPLQTVYHGENGSAVEAIPETGYCFTGWSDGYVANPRTDSLVTADLYATAAFRPLDQFSVSLDSSPPGAGNLSGAGTYYEGSTVIITADANYGYVFKNWSIDDTILSDDAVVEFEITGDISLIANFEPLQFEVSATVIPEGTGTVSGAGTHPYGEEIELTAIPSDGHAFVAWKEDGEPLGTKERLTLLVASDRHLQAHFEKKIYTLLYGAAPGGYISGNTEQFVSHGENGSAVEAIPETGYSFSAWSDGATVNPRTDSLVTAHLQVTAGFLPLGQFQIALDSSPPGAGTLTGAGNYYEGDTARVAATANYGYVFKNWSLGDIILSDDAVYEFEVTSHMNLMATFEPRQFEVSVSIVPDGAGSVNGAGTYPFGEEIELTAVPYEGYVFSGWFEDGAQVTKQAASASEESILIEVSGNRQLEARFALIEYSVHVQASPPAFGQAEILTEAPFTHGKDIIIKASPEAGYVFVHWLEDGDTLSDNTEYHFPVLSDRSFLAVFREKTYTARFVVEHEDGQKINDAVIVFADSVYDKGIYAFPGLVAGSYSYTVQKEWFFPDSGTIQIDARDVEKLIVLKPDNTGFPDLQQNLSRNEAAMVYPNPAHSQMTILSAVPIYRLRVYDQQGRLVLFIKDPTHPTKTILNVEGLKNGVYLVQMQHAGGFSTTTFIVSR